MSRTLSSMMPLGTVAPDFNLLDTVSGKNVSLSDIKSDKGTVVMFICNHCPYVIHVHDQIKSISEEYLQKGIAFVAISSNDVENYPQDSPELMKQLAEDLNFNFPYLYDEAQHVAKAYEAECTPDFFVFDGEQKCVYRGRMDSSTPGNGVPLTGEDLRRTLDNLLKGLPVDTEQHPSMGCNIKWKS